MNATSTTRLGSSTPSFANESPTPRAGLDSGAPSRFAALLGERTTRAESMGNAFAVAPPPIAAKPAPPQPAPRQAEARTPQTQTQTRPTAPRESDAARQADTTEARRQAQAAPRRAAEARAEARAADQREPAVRERGPRAGEAAANEATTPAGTPGPEEPAVAAKDGGGPMALWAQLAQTPAEPRTPMGAAGSPAGAASDADAGAAAGGDAAAGLQAPGQAGAGRPGGKDTLGSAKLGVETSTDSAAKGAGSGPATDAADEGAFAAALAGLATGPAATAAQDAIATPHDALPAPIASAPPPGGRSDAPSATAPSVPVPTPMNAPEFAQAFATQVSTLTRDGVQEAHLQMNPAEMGPITVQIVLDGTQAQIDFTAAHPAARQALEAGLPALAAALQGEGLTLAGGGVFDQRPGRGGDSDGSRQGSQDRGGDTRGRLDGADATSPRAGRATAARGLVDLVA